VGIAKQFEPIAQLWRLCERSHISTADFSRRVDCAPDDAISGWLRGSGCNKRLGARVDVVKVANTRGIREGENRAPANTACGRLSAGLKSAATRSQRKWRRSTRPPGNFLPHFDTLHACVERTFDTHSGQNNGRSLFVSAPISSSVIAFERKNVALTTMMQPICETSSPGACLKPRRIRSSRTCVSSSELQPFASAKHSHASHSGKAEYLAKYPTPAIALCGAFNYTLRITVCLMLLRRLQSRAHPGAC
jgi:hypothetical protein